ncbi:hypothetical protein [Shewanella baltica]|uniref:hypothetical protein n=1 Tax=Shewanella baltica TaxID=62322 RepID=UPI0003260A79|nr:hypothetical protein [Shewanella baltica]
MELRTFRKTRLATSLSLVLGVGSIMPAYAADTDKKEENIEVYSASISLADPATINLAG